MMASTTGGDFFPFNEVELKSGKYGRVGGSAFGSINRDVRTKVAAASAGSSGAAAVMPPTPSIFSMMGFGKKEEAPVEEEKSSGGFKNPFAALFSGSNLKEPKKSADGKNFFDVQATTIQGKKVKMG